MAWPPFLDRLLGGAPAPRLTKRLDSSDLSVLQAEGVAVGSTSGMVNYLSGAGTHRDKGTATRPNVTRRFLLVPELVAMMRGGIYRRICSTRPSWATRAGWTFGAEETDAASKKLAVLSHFRRADTWGRALGEHRLWIVTDAKDLSKPLRKGEQVKRLQPVFRREFWPIEFNADAIAGEVGRATSYTVQFTRPGIVSEPLTIHASRLLDFYGHDIPNDERGVESWGDRDAIGQVIWDALAGLDTVSGAGPRIASELLISVFKVANLQGITTSDQAETWFERVMGVNLMKSLTNGIWLDKEEDFQRNPANVAGFRDLSEATRLWLSAVEGTPQTLLYGMAPAGFNTDGESWQEMWYADVAQHQEDRYRGHLEYLGWHLQGGEDVDLNFNPLGELDALERAQVRLMTTQADSVAITDGVLSADIARTRYSEAGVFHQELPEAVAELPDLLGMEPVVDPEAEASARAMVEAAATAEQAPEAPDGGDERA